MRSRLAIAPVLAAVGLAFAAAGAQGAVVSGSNLSQPVDTYLCPAFAIPASCTLSISSLPAATTAAGGARAGIDGVIVGWSIRKAGVSEVQGRLHVTRGNASVGVGPQETLPSSPGIYSFPARVPVRAGDQIGIDVELPPFGEIGIARSPIGGASYDFWQPALGPTETRSPSQDDTANYELLINATIEPDADGDGFGDETQDSCASDGATQGACPAVAPPAPVAPETKIGKGPAGTIHRAKATFRFSSSVPGSTFLCKFDKKPFKACRSPKTYRGLADGKHVFRVKAVGPTGLADTTAARRVFRVQL